MMPLVCVHGKVTVNTATKHNNNSLCQCGGMLLHLAVSSQYMYTHNHNNNEPNSYSKSVQYNCVLPGDNSIMNSCNMCTLVHGICSQSVIPNGRAQENKLTWGGGGGGAAKAIQ